MGNRYFVLVFILLIIPLGRLSANFEGYISIIKETLFDTTRYNYFVKGDMVRIEELDRNQKAKNVLLVNIKSEDIFAISPSKKLYTKLNRKKDLIGEENQYVITKSDNFKMISGYKCYQWRVKNKSKATEISYWVAKNDLDFFEKLINILGSTENTTEFYRHIPDTQGFFPMLVVERTMVRDEKMRTTVVEIAPKSINAKLFEIPSDYKLYVY